MSLLMASDIRRGENLSGQVLARKVEQTLINYAIIIKAAFRDDSENNTNPYRLEFANLIMTNVTAAMATVMPYVAQNTTVQAQVGDIAESDLVWVIETTVNSHYPAVL